MVVTGEPPLDHVDRDPAITASTDTDASQIAAITQPGHPRPRCVRGFAEQHSGDLGDPQQPGSAIGEFYRVTFSHVSVEPDPTAQRGVAETSLGEEIPDPWQQTALSMLEHGVGPVTVGEHGVTIHGDGCRPVVGKYRQLDGQRVVIPATRGASRRRHRELLDAIAGVLGLRAPHRPPGRPHGGVYDRACRWIDQRPDGVSLAERVRQAAGLIGCDRQSVLRRYRRWKRTQRSEGRRRDQ